MSETTDDPLPPSGISREKPSKILGVVSLTRVLSAAQIKSEVQSQTVLVRLADLSPELADATQLGEFRLSVDAESNRIDAVLPVKTITSIESVKGPKLIGLLLALSKIPGVQLTTLGQTIALHGSLINQNVTPQEIRTVAEQLIAAAKKTAPIMSTIVEEEEQTLTGSVANESVQPKPQPTTLTSAAKPASVVGTWSSKTSASDAWAIRFHADNTFVMVHTRSGKNSVSKGTYQATKDRLVVSETGGVTLKGQLTRSSEKTLTWKLQNDSGQTLTTLQFKKQ